MKNESVAALQCCSSKLSEHFSLRELTKTNTGIDNVPNEEQVNNLKRVCQWLERLRSKRNEPIIINSGYRSPQVNKAVGGAPNSNHLTGCAVDIHVSGMEQLIRYAAILLDISDERQEDFDELLLERSPRGSYWLHFAVRPFGNRRRINLICQ
jgi:hypothetical protein